MIFACTHPALPPDSRVAVTLKAACGLSVAEIARAFLAAEPTIAQRLVRAKQLIRERGLTLSLPDPEQLADRLDSVLQVVYLLFNEGHFAHAGDALIRHELCGEAIWLADLLVRRRETALPKVYALLALMELQASRLPARLDESGTWSSCRSGPVALGRKPDRPGAPPPRPRGRRRRPDELSPPGGDRGHPRGRGRPRVHRLAAPARPL
jgi:predicted RNA polymerase sigma factor